VSFKVAPRLEDVLREVAAGTPVVVLHGYGVWPLRYWHYSVVIGYDRAESHVILRSGTRERMTMPFAVLEYTWKESARWAMLATRAGRMPVTADESYVEAIHAMARVAEPRASVSAYREFLKRSPANLSASIGLANALHASGELKAAEASLRAALKDHPDSPVVLNNLAQALSDQGRHREALDLVERALKNAGTFEAAIRETRSMVRRKLGIDR
jgi:tetratricopeptide (TPR) repeat protein